MTKYTKRRPSRKQKSAPVNSKREPLAVYDGRRLLGTFLDDEKSGEVLAWNAERELLGRFSDAKQAAAAINDVALAADARKAATAEALERLNRPDVEFASGLPTELAGGGRRR